jgi:DNA-binding transcriptional ArsR family regulator
MSRATIEVGLLAENEMRCAPPLVPGEVVRIAKSISSSPVEAHDRVFDRLGVLADRLWIPLPFATLVDARFSIKPAESKAIQAVLAQHTGDMQWGSFSQLFRAAQFGIPPSTFGGQLRRVRKMGFVTARPDTRFPGTHGRSPLTYAAEPYLVMLELWSGDLWPNLRGVCEQAAAERMERHVRSVEKGEWQWQVDELSTKRGEPASRLAELFLANYRPGLPDEGQLGPFTGIRI